MNRQNRKPARSLLAIPALLLVITALTASTALAAIPSTADYRNATQPMITGTVTTASQNELIVATEQGDEVTLTLDSRSVVPSVLAPDMMVRVEFHYLNNGSRHAERVIPVRSGEKTTRELAYSTERDGDEANVRLASTGKVDEYKAEDSEGWRVVNASDTEASATHSARTIPATHAYDIATRPMIAGQVTRVNDQRIVVATEQSGRVTLQMDSRTLVPSTLKSGMGVRIDYVALENGEYLARRVTENGRYAGTRDDMAYEDTEHTGDHGDRDAVPAAYASHQDDADASYAADQDAKDTDTGSGSGSSDNGENGTDGSMTAVREAPLPATASPAPLMGFLGILALGAGGGLALRRRRNA